MTEEVKQPERISIASIVSLVMTLTGMLLLLVFREENSFSGGMFLMSIILAFIGMIPANRKKNFSIFAMIVALIPVGMVICCLVLLGSEKNWP
jgi:hypothetical protein